MTVAQILAPSAVAAPDDEPLRRRAVLCADISESTRFFESDAEGAVRRWTAFMDWLVDTLAPAHGAEFVKSRGDGFLVSAPTEAQAVDMAVASLEMAAAMQGEGMPLRLRIGVAAGPLRRTRHDVYGHAANLSARLSDLARPGEVVMSDDVRRALPPDLEARAADRGPCFVRNVAEPVRAHAIDIGAPPSPLAPLMSDDTLKPRVAVAPFRPEEGGRPGVTGEALADGVIVEMSRSAHLRCVSRLSTSRLAARGVLDAAGIGGLGPSGGFAGGRAPGEDPGYAARAHLRADYLLTGRFRREDGRLAVIAELSETAYGDVLWSERLEGSISELLGGGRELAFEIAARAVAAALRIELDRYRAPYLPTQQSYTLLLAGVSQLHSLSREHFAEAERPLSALVDRATRQPTPRAWLAKWHIMRILQGWSPDEARDSAMAFSLVDQALDSDPDCALALCMRGLADTVLRQRPDLGRDYYDAAQKANPSEPMAWLLSGAQRSFTDDGAGAMHDAAQAIALSPVDPHRYLFQAIAAGAALTAGDDAQALAYANASLRANSQHISTLRVKAAAEWRLDRPEDARRTIARLLELSPGATVSRYLASAPNTEFRIGREIARILGQAGLPA
ncbi:MAG: adenylate/guanylate cyclase domain-containing protein [Pseudomonadota bacterium]|nr:adenylate/guanylate cyclase domain-containing protein [Pseudomonadota bacterium]